MPKDSNIIDGTHSGAPTACSINAGKRADMPATPTTDRLFKMGEYRLADKLRVVPELMTASHKKVRFPKPKAFDMHMEHRVTRLDLDFNFHVSNRSYISIALLTMPDEVLASQTMTSLAVHWLHESYMDDSLTCRMSQVGEGNFIHTLTNGEGVAVCELMSSWQPQTEATDVSEVLNRDM